MLLMEITLPTPCTAMHYQGTSSPCKRLDFCVDPVILASTLIRVMLSVPYSVKTELFHVLNYFLVRFLYLLQIFNHFFPEGL